MHKIKTAAMALALSLFVTGLCACGTVSVDVTLPDKSAEAEVPEDDGKGDLIEEEADEDDGKGDLVEDEEADDSKVTRAAAADFSWMDLYVDVVLDLYDDGKADQFALMYIDDDEVPELIAVSSEGSWDKDQVFVYTFYSDGVTELVSDIAPGMEGHYIGIFEEDNIIEVSGAVAGERHQYCGIDKGKLDPLLTLECIDDTETDDVLYMIDGDDATEKEYTSAQIDLVENLGYMTKLEVDEMVVYSLDYKNGSIQMNQEFTLPYSDVEEIIDEIG
ncbi:MAG: hypothetical protein K6F73_07190 [Lachnospiraceae bacterium]|nr:hypothetical protein [Lachnospiraceae bacterium]